ncbi:MAG TPA: hypothetical protein VGR71_14525 [Nitrospira sp.]|nr:hypothetical protein [Nitrospira sp.]
MRREQTLFHRSEEAGHFHFGNLRRIHAVLVDRTAMVGETASIPDNQRFGKLPFGRMRRSFLHSLDVKMIAVTGSS